MKQAMAEAREKYMGTWEGGGVRGEEKELKECLVEWWVAKKQPAFKKLLGTRDDNVKKVAWKFIKKKR